jgi:hypothetical protein
MEKVLYYTIFYIFLLIFYYFVGFEVTMVTLLLIILAKMR